MAAVRAADALASDRKRYAAEAIEMVSALNPVQERELVRPAANGRTGPNGTATREIPYDFVARFTLSGKPGNRLTDVFNISTDGAFVAVSIAHSFDPGPLDIKASLEAWCADSVVCAAADEERGRGLCEVDPAQTSRCRPSESNVKRWEFVQKAIDFVDLRRLFRRVFDFQFKYSIIDSGSGRELQNLPIPSLAGLGNAEGFRPFRTLPKPMFFLPRSTIRIEVEEISRGLLYAGAELTIVLHGYKILGYGASGS